MPKKGKKTTVCLFQQQLQGGHSLNKQKAIEFGKEKQTSENDQLRSLQEIFFGVLDKDVIEDILLSYGKNTERATEVLLGLAAEAERTREVGGCLSDRELDGAVQEEEEGMPSPVAALSTSDKEQAEECKGKRKNQEQQENPRTSRGAEKIEECVMWQQMVQCKYGNKCSFGHPAKDATTQKLYTYPQNPGKPICRYFERQGTCKAHGKCNLDHPQPNGVRIPVCYGFMMTGECPRGELCVFRHLNAEEAEKDAKQWDKERQQICKQVAIQTKKQKRKGRKSKSEPSSPDFSSQSLSSKENLLKQALKINEEVQERNFEALAEEPCKMLADELDTLPLSPPLPLNRRVSVSVDSKQEPPMPTDFPNLQRSSSNPESSHAAPINSLPQNFMPAPGPMPFGLPHHLPPPWHADLYPPMHPMEMVAPPFGSPWFHGMAGPPFMQHPFPHQHFPRPFLGKGESGPEEKEVVADNRDATTPASSKPSAQLTHHWSKVPERKDRKSIHTSKGRYQSGGSRSQSRGANKRGSPGRRKGKGPGRMPQQVIDHLRLSAQGKVQQRRFRGWWEPLQNFLFPPPRRMICTRAGIDTLLQVMEKQTPYSPSGPQETIPKLKEGCPTLSSKTDLKNMIDNVQTAVAQVAETKQHNEAGLEQELPLPKSSVGSHQNSVAASPAQPRSRSFQRSSQQKEFIGSDTSRAGSSVGERRSPEDSLGMDIAKELTEEFDQLEEDAIAEEEEVSLEDSWLMLCDMFENLLGIEQIGNAFQGCSCNLEAAVEACILAAETETMDLPLDELPISGNAEFKNEDTFAFDSLSESQKEVAETLSEMFPDQDMSVLLSVAQLCEFDLESTVRFFFDDKDSHQLKRKIGKKWNYTLKKGQASSYAQAITGVEPHCTRSLSCPSPAEFPSLNLNGPLSTNTLHDTHFINSSIFNSLKLKKLQQRFVTFDASFVEQVFTSNNFDAEITEDILFIYHPEKYFQSLQNDRKRDLRQAVLSKFQIAPDGVLPTNDDLDPYESSRVEMHKSLTLVGRRTQPVPISDSSYPLYQPFDLKGCENLPPVELRKMAQSAKQEMISCFRQAAREYRSKQPGKVLPHAAHGSVFKKRMQCLNFLAARKFIMETNSDCLQLTDLHDKDFEFCLAIAKLIFPESGCMRLDLHSLTVAEAIQLLHSFVHKFRQHNIALEGSQESAFHIVTGIGLHSQMGKPRLRKATSSFLSRQEIQYSYSNGVFECRLGKK